MRLVINCHALCFETICLFDRCILIECELCVRRMEWYIDLHGNRAIQPDEIKYYCSIMFEAIFGNYEISIL